MGNSQSSVEHAVDKGIHLYKAVKKFQHEFEANNQQQYDGNTSAPHYEHEEDSADYSRLRELAHQEAAKRNNCYEQSQEAYRNGDGAQAKQLSNQGHYHDDLMKRYNQQAADLVFEEKNAHRPDDEIDLHGLFVKEATEKVDEALRRCQRNGQDHLTIIVGKGLHSPGQIAKLKPAIAGMIQKHNVRCTPDRPNPGCLYVEFGQGTGDLSWLDRITDRVDRGDCAIM
ncbi:hypothetical protein BDB00DRAFT_755032 [Zychaea mexicana]|uniref:uncharacterized protein n=1 Tax=Zychaea mexicana TaxID=64656 RepID=UPI0022FEFC43|nr:uncharacterized protein BDB00DRAFT_755032 [Zychaea mexicana]KAI9498275.1 hypothetical protein BDB00DRAFT_755032 [Zychaea mexicana]